MPLTGTSITNLLGYLPTYLPAYLLPYSLVSFHDRSMSRLIDRSIERLIAISRISHLTIDVIRRPFHVSSDVVAIDAVVLTCVIGLFEYKHAK